MLPEGVAGPEKRQLALYPSTAADPSSARQVFLVVVTMALGGTCAALRIVV